MDGEAVLHEISQGLTDFGFSPFPPEVELQLIDALEAMKTDFCAGCGFLYMEHRPSDNHCPGGAPDDTFSYCPGDPKGYVDEAGSVCLRGFTHHEHVDRGRCPGTP